MASVRSGTQLQSQAPISQSQSPDTLKRGSPPGEAVRALQEQLIKLGASLTADGKFGAATEDALKQWQEGAGLKADGKAGPQTRAALAKALGRQKQSQAGRQTPGQAQTQGPSWSPTRPGQQQTQAQAPNAVTGTGQAGQGTASPATRQIGEALNQGFQYLIGGEGEHEGTDAFRVAKQRLLAAGAKGAAIVQRPTMGTPAEAKAAVAELKRAGITPYAYNNAFQTESDDEAKAWAGKARLGTDKDWDEVQPDFRKLPAWREKRIGEAVAVAKAGFGGVMLDNVPVVTSKLISEDTVEAGLKGDQRAFQAAQKATQPAVDYIKEMAVRARRESGNEAFAIMLQNGDALVRLHPELVTQGYVNAVQKEGVLFGNKVSRDAKTGEFHSRAGIPTPASWGHMEAFQALRRQFPDLPLTAVEYTKDSDQSATARQKLGGSSGVFNRVLTAENDVMLNKARAAAAGRRYEPR